MLSWSLLILLLLLPGCAATVVDDGSILARSKPLPHHAPGREVTPQVVKEAFGADSLTRIQEVKARIEAVADEKTQLMIFAGGVANAFAWEENGQLKIGINLGLLYLIDGDFDQLAFVMGHEIAHHKAQHLTTGREKRETVENLGNFLGAAMNLAGVPGGDVFGYLGMLSWSRKYSRDDELAADRLAKSYLQKAGFNPQAAVDFQKKLAQQPEMQTVPFLRTHPFGAERIKQLETIN